MHVLVPLRWLIYPTMPAWSEEGHLYAWHMKQRHKSGSILLYAIIEVDANQTFQKKTSNFSKSRAIRFHLNADPFLQTGTHLVSRPVSLLQYAHHIHQLLILNKYRVRAI